MKIFFTIFVFLPINLIAWFISLYLSFLGLGELYDIYTTRMYKEDFKIEFLYFDEIGVSQISKSRKPNYSYHYLGYIGKTEVKFGIENRDFNYARIGYQVPKQIWARKVDKYNYQVFIKKDNALLFRPKEYARWSYIYTLSYLIFIISTRLFPFLLKLIKE